MLSRLPRLPADAVVLDLEDGVAPDAKSGARERLREAGLRETLDRLPGWMVRINAAGTPWHGEDLRLVEEIAPPRVVLAKAEDEAAVAAVADAVGQAGGRLGLMIETATGLARVRELAGHPSVDVLVYGSADFRLSIGARADAERSWERTVLFEILLAARTNGCAAIDSVYFRFRDDEGLAHDARVARDLGFDGKSCIHPDQVATIHRVFASDPEEVVWARAVLAAWSEQDGERRGIVTLDGGEMIEALHLRMARRILARDTR